VQVYMIKEIFEIFSSIFEDPKEVIAISFFIIVFIQILKFQNKSVENYEIRKDEYVSEAIGVYLSIYQDILSEGLITKNDKFFETISPILAYCSTDLFNEIVEKQSQGNITLDDREKILAKFSNELRSLKLDQYWSIDLNSEAQVTFYKLAKKYGIIRIVKVIVTTLISYFMAILLILFITRTYGKSDAVMFLYSLATCLSILSIMVALYWYDEMNRLFRQGNKSRGILVVVLAIVQVIALKVIENIGFSGNHLLFIMTAIAVSHMVIISLYKKKSTSSIS